MTAQRCNGRKETFSGQNVKEITVSVNDSILVLLNDGTCIEAESITA